MALTSDIVFTVAPGADGLVGRGSVDPEVTFAVVFERVSAEVSPCALKRRGCLVPFPALPGVGGFGTER
jgi:hypothetical protein